MIQHRIGALEKVNHEFKMPAITPLKTQQIERKKKRKRNGARKLPGRHLLQQFTLGATSPSFHYGLCNDQRISYAAVPLQLNISCTRLSGSKRGGQYFKDRSARRRTRAPYQRGDAAAGVGQYFWLCWLRPKVLKEDLRCEQGASKPSHL